MVTTVKGEWSSRRGGVDDGELSPQRSQQLVYHPRNGFNWGYGGSGPAQLSLTLLLLFVSEQNAIHLHKYFKWKYIATLPEGDIKLNSEQIDTMRKWTKEQGVEIKEDTNRLSR